MLHDGYWPNELISLSNRIRYWKRKVNKMLSDGKLYSDVACQKGIHQLQLNIFISATIVRKILEEENEFNTFSNKYRNSPFYERPVKNHWFHLFNLRMNVLKVPLIGEIECAWTAYFKTFCIEHYAMPLQEKDEEKLNDICNWIIHSYVWHLGDIKKAKCISGFFVSSDRTKEECAYYVLIDDWISILKDCAEKAYL